MKRFLINPALVILALASVSCTSTVIKGNVDGMQDSDLVVKRLDVNVVNVLDTVKTDASGAFSYKADVEEGQPEFLYLCKGDKTLVSLIVNKGDNITVKADTLGSYSVEGSPESEKLRTLNNDFSEFITKFRSTANEFAAAEPGTYRYSELSKTLSKQYVDYYRSRLKYLADNPKSMTLVPLLYQEINSAFPVFSQQTDALRFRAASDSLKTVYPKSRYVQALAEEASRRERIMDLNNRIKNAPSMDFPEIEMPDVTGKKVKLSEVGSKVVLLEFWDASVASQKMLNLDVLKPVYEEFHGKGLEIFQVALTQDKAVWATTVRSQELPWICVNDGLGYASVSASTMYNVAVLPMAFLIVDGKLVPAKVSDKASLRKELAKYLK